MAERTIENSYDDNRLTHPTPNRQAGSQTYLRALIAFAETLDETAFYAQLDAWAAQVGIAPGETFQADNRWRKFTAANRADGEKSPDAWSGAIPSSLHTSSPLDKVEPMGLTAALGGSDRSGAKDGSRTS